MSGRTTPPAAFEPSYPSQASPFDPIRLCVYSTIALLAWLLTPAAMMTVFSGVALVAYWRARRAGLVKSRCKLGDTRLVMTYLGVLFLTGSGFTLYRVLQLMG